MIVIIHANHRFVFQEMGFHLFDVVFIICFVFLLISRFESCQCIGFHSFQFVFRKSESFCPFVFSKNGFEGYVFLVGFCRCGNVIGVIPSDEAAETDLPAQERWIGLLHDFADPGV